MMFAALFAPFLGRITSYEALDYDSVADPKATVTRGNARFTVLTPQLIRFEQSATTTFEDRATLAIVNRKLPVPKFTASDANGAAQKSAQIIGAISHAARPLQAS